jgi:hypothetical protein
MGLSVRTVTVFGKDDECRAFRNDLWTKEKGAPNALDN